MWQTGHTAAELRESQSTGGTKHADGMLSGQLFGPGGNTTPEYWIDGPRIRRTLGVHSQRAQGSGGGSRVHNARRKPGSGLALPPHAQAIYRAVRSVIRIAASERRSLHAGNVREMLDLMLR